MKQLIIHNKKAIQDNFLGLNAVYHGFAGAKDNDGRVYSEELCELEANLAADLGVKIARTHYQWIAYDFENEKWDWDNSPNFNAFCSWVGRLKKRGIDVALNTSWSNITDIMSNGWGGKSPFTTDNNWEKSVKKYAEWVSESVYQLVEKRGLTNVKYLIMFTEPQHYTGPSELPEGVSHHWEGWYQAVCAVDEQLKKDGRRHLVKLVGPNEGSTYEPKMLKWLKNKDSNLIDIYSAHNYLNRVSNRNDARKENENFIEIDKAGIRIWQPVNLKPNTEYKFGFYAKLKVDSPKSISGYILAGAFNLNNDGVIDSGGAPTTRLGRYTTTMVESSRIEQEWQYISCDFSTDDNVDDAVVGVFCDVKSAPHKLYLSGFSLKEKGTQSEMLLNPELNNGMFHWGVFMENYRDTAFENQYDFWMHCCELYKSSISENDDFWFDEYNTLSYQPKGFDFTKLGLHKLTDPACGTDLAVARIAFLNAGIQSSLIWTLFDQLWPNSHSNSCATWYDGVHACGVMPCLLQSTVPKPTYFAIRITGLVGGGEGTKIYKGDGDGLLYVSMTESPQNEITVLVVNESNEELSFNLNFEKPINTNLARYTYSPDSVECKENIQPLSSDKIFAEVSDLLVDTIPAGGVVAYTNRKI